MAKTTANAPQSGTGSSNLAKHPPPIAPWRTACVTARSRSPVTVVSASTKISKSPCATRAPALRVAAICRCCTWTVRSASCSAICPVRSVEPSLATTISNRSPSDPAAARMQVNVAARCASSFQAGTMKETRPILLARWLGSITSVVLTVCGWCHHAELAPFTSSPTGIRRPI